MFLPKVWLFKIYGQTTYYSAEFIEYYTSWTGDRLYGVSQASNAIRQALQKQRRELKRYLQLPTQKQPEKERQKEKKEYIKTFPETKPPKKPNIYCFLEREANFLKIKLYITLDSTFVPGIKKWQVLFEL